MAKIISIRTAIIMKEIERNAAYDYLRVLASFGVIILHIAAKKFLSISVDSDEWIFLNFYDSIVRWTVPVFVMISGALFLERDIPLKRIYLRYIMRLAAAFVIWSFTYAISSGYNFKEHKIMWLSGHYHMWYIPMCIGLYMVLPIMKQMISNTRISYYYLFLALIFAFILPSMISFANEFGPQYIDGIVRMVRDIVTDMNMKLVLGFPTYFILGYTLSKLELKKRKNIRRCIYVLGIIGFLMTFFCTLLASHLKGEGVTTYYDFFAVNVLLESMAVFTLFICADLKNKKFNKIMAALSKYSFGAYLIHPMLIEKSASMFNITPVSFYPGISVPVLSCAVFAMSYVITFLLGHVPVLNKYII